MGMRGLLPNSRLATKPRYWIIIRLIELRKKAKLTVPQLARLAGLNLEICQVGTIYRLAVVQKYPKVGICSRL
jgi:hypothetical protein